MIGYLLVRDRCSIRLFHLSAPWILLFLFSLFDFIVFWGVKVPLQDVKASLGKGNGCMTCIRGWGMLKIGLAD